MQQLRRPVAAHPQCVRLRGPSPELFFRLRRQPATGASSARPSCSSKASCARIAACSTCWTPTTRSSTSVWPALRHSRRVRRAIPAGVAPGRQRAPWPAGAGLDPDGTSRPEPDLAGDPRQVDPREHPRRAAAAATAGRARAEGSERQRQGAARCASRWRSTGPTRSAPAATPRWTRSGSRWRISMRSASGGDVDAAGRPIDASGESSRRHAVRRADGAPAACCSDVPTSSSTPSPKSC